MKIVLDSNVLLSGLILPQSIPGRIISAWREAHFDLVLSEAMLSELRRVLSYPKIEKRLQWNDVMIERFLSLLRFRSLTVDPPQRVFKVLRDPDDAIMLSALLVADADFLVTGDKDLLILSDRYPILSPAEFSKKL